MTFYVKERLRRCVVCGVCEEEKIKHNFQEKEDLLIEKKM